MIARLILACCIALALAAAAAAAEPTAESGEQLAQRVRPLLENRCVECHGERRQKAKLRLDSRAALLAGGDAGPAIVIGDADHSLLIQRVRARGTDDVM